MDGWMGSLTVDDDAFFYIGDVISSAIIVDKDFGNMHLSATDNRFLPSAMLVLKGIHCCFWLNLKHLLKVEHTHYKGFTY